MPRFPTVSAREIIKVLEKSGFEFHRSRGSHQIYIHREKRLRTVVPVHKGKDLGRGLTLKILKDAGITVEEFVKIK